MSTNPTQVKAADLTVGTWISTGDGPAEVLLAQPFTDADGPGLHLTYRFASGSIGTYAATPDLPFEVVTETHLAYLKAAAERAQKVADIRRLADWLEANPDVPMPYMTQASEHWNNHHGDPDTSAAMATIRNLGQMYDVKLDEHLDDRTRFVVPFGKTSYELVVWHKDGRPADPEPERCETCGESLREIERGTLGHIPGEACAPVTDPLGLAYTRADDQDDPTPTGPRGPLHTGGMTEGGLVDETCGYWDPSVTSVPVAADTGPCWHGEIAPGRDCPGSGPDCGPA